MDDNAEISTKKSTRLLGVSQLCFGFTLCCLGIGVAFYLRDFYLLSGGIWSGIWICVTGVVGVIIATDGPMKATLKIIYFILNVVSTIFSIVNLTYFSMGLRLHVKWGANLHHDHEDVKHIYQALAKLLIVELVVAVAIASYCCYSAVKCKLRSRESHRHIPYEMYI